MAGSEAQRMYQQLKTAWQNGHPEGPEEAAQEFDQFIAALMKHGEKVQTDDQVQEQRQHQDPWDDSQQSDGPEIPSQTTILMEIILELDTAMLMVPKRLKAYRDKLAEEGLDRTSQAEGEGGQKGMAGINLADQAALEFHRALMGLAVNIAQAEVQERIEKKIREQQGGGGQDG